MNNNKEVSAIKIYNCDFEVIEHSYDNGHILTTKKELKVATSNGYLNIYEIKIPGKRKMDVKSLLNVFTLDENSKMM
jgi:methionyl-tRNA formyltransferase